MKSRVHPKYKTKYHVGNWSAYDRVLVQRGDITVWLAPDAIATWEAVGVGTRGGQRQYSDLAIETALTLRLISTGLSIVGEGEWAAVKHGGRGRRGWKKLHLGVDDATTGITLIEAVEAPSDG